ncbi:hypothetical protein PRZ48_010942 [Zasmidium cellare]|uniref:Alcohol dehydrogenase-like N-terminal domain-containing protein n=1 Tax=Zasmidium cellare TaxID=395010 RepID=A0ABR0EAD9_ZASCE|nr:hypothetical protein PRZ48_010942 [Zasmidium cellare]
MTNKMKAVRFHAAKDIRVEEVPVPEVKPGWIRVKPAFCGICGSGVVDEVGEGVSGFKPGDKVAVQPTIYDGDCRACLKGLTNSCDTFGFIGLSGWGGGMSEYTCAPAEYVKKLPDDMGLDLGALVEPLSVGWHAVATSPYKDGDNVLVLGGGPIGGTFVNIALWGAKRVALDMNVMLFGERRYMAVVTYIDGDFEAVIEAIHSGKMKPHGMITKVIRPDEDFTRRYEHSSIASIRPHEGQSRSDPEVFKDWASLGASNLVQEALRSNLELTLMHNYLTEVALWFDAHSGVQYYSRVEVPRMLSCPPWRAAALALSAKNILLRERCLLTPQDDTLPLHLYQFAVRLAIDAMSGRFDKVGTLAGCVLLSVYEMMTVTYTDWRRHVQGCASIYTHNHWNGSTGGLVSGSFWDFARIDIWAAFSASTQTIMGPETWFDDPDDVACLSNVDEDLHAQIAIWLTAKVVNMANGAKLSTTDTEALVASMSAWESMGSEATRPVVTRMPGADIGNPFPQILFSTHSSTIGHTMWNSAMVLLLEHQAKGQSTEKQALRDRAYHHALQAAGIIGTNNHTACLVNSLQPAYICGRHMRTEREKSAILDLLAQIERKTGWRCDWRADGLREFWKDS